MYENLILKENIQDNITIHLVSIKSEKNIPSDFNINLKNPHPDTEATTRKIRHKRKLKTAENFQMFKLYSIIILAVQRKETPSGHEGARKAEII